MSSEEADQGLEADGAKQPLKLRVGVPQRDAQQGQGWRAIPRSGARRVLYWARMGYERLIREADHIPFEGWDFGVFRGRFVEARPAWESSKLVRTHMRRCSSMLDLVVGRHESYASYLGRRVLLFAAGEPS